MIKPSIPAPPKTKIGNIGGIRDGIALSSFCGLFGVIFGIELLSTGWLGAGIASKFAGTVNVGSNVGLPTV